MEVSLGRKFWVPQPTAWPTFFCCFFANLLGSSFYVAGHRVEPTVMKMKKKDEIVLSISVSRLEEKEVM